MRPNPRETAYLVTFTEEILNGKLHFYAVQCKWRIEYWKVLRFIIEDSITLSSLKLFC